nr:carbohydrate ABC transporter permease [uncultured Cellulosilyticum sp.]
MIKRRHLGAKDIFFSILKYASLILASLIALVPILVVFFASFKDSKEFKSTSALALPKNFFNLENYVTAFVKGKMLTGFLNTLIIMGISLIGVILIGTMLAYVLHRFNFKFKKVILGAFLLATLIPGVTTQVATFQVISALGIYNTRLAPIFLYMGTDIISIYIFLQFMDNISISMDEAAMIEGASYFTIYRKVILPLLKPAIATVVIIKGVGIYNDFYTPFLYMPNTKLNVLSTALFKFKGPYSAQWEVICACIMIVVIPTFIAFLLLQKYIYNGFTSGSVK